MLRRNILRFITFDSLLCGVPSCSVNLPLSNTGKAVAQYRCKSVEASIPAPLATSSALSLAKEKNFLPIIALLSGHPQRESVVRVLCERLCTESSFVDLEDWVSLLKTLRHLDVSSDVIALAANYACQKVSGSEYANIQTPIRESFLEDMAKLRLWITRFTRYHSFVAPLTLPSLCLLSEGVKGEMGGAVVDDLLEVTLYALRQGNVSPDSCGRVISLMEQPRRVLPLWRWMQFTSAKWNQRAASAAVIAFSRHNRFADAVTTLQTLAVVGVHPTIVAQATFLDLLSRTSPPLPEYGDQLVEYWHPSEKTRWTYEVVNVTAAHIYLHFRCGNYDRCFDILNSTAEHLFASPLSGREKQMGVTQLIKNRKMFIVARYFLDEISKSSTLFRLFFEEPLKNIEDFSSCPTAISLFFGIAHRLDEEKRNASLQKISTIKHLIDDNSFEKIVRTVAEDLCSETSQLTLEYVSRIGSLLEKELSSQLVAWIKLA